MAQQQKKFIGNNQVDGTKIRTLNDQFIRGRNQADNGDINIVKINASNAIEFGAALNLGGFEAFNAADPTTAQSLATRAYVLAQVIAAGVPSTPVRVAVDFDTSIVSPGTDTFYGVTLASGDLLLLFGQADNTENGVYVFDTDSTPLVRDEAWDAPAEFTKGRLVYAQDGATKYSPALFALQQTAATLGTDPVVFDLVGFDSEVLSKDLIPWDNEVVNIGSVSNRVNEIHTAEIILDLVSDVSLINSGDNGLVVTSGTQADSDPSQTVMITSGGAQDGGSGLVTLASGNVSGGTDIGSSGGIDIHTGDTVDGDSGNIDIYASIPSGAGNQGNVRMSAEHVALRDMADGKTVPLRFYDADSSHYVGFKAPNAVTTTVTYDLPVAPPAVNGYVLSATTAGVMSWVAQSGGGANTALSNLASVAINLALEFGTGVNGQISTPDSATASAPMTVRTGDGAADDATTGGVIIRSGETTGTGTSGNLILSSGQTEDGASGGITISTGDTTNDGDVGNINILGGAAGGTGAASNINITAGQGGPSGAVGGTVTIKGGNGNAADAGDVVIEGGDDSGPGVTGNVILRPGQILGGGATEGVIKLNQGTPTVGWVWTATNADGSGEWAAPAGSSATWEKETFTLNGTNITNQYIDLANVADVDSIDFFIRGGGIQQEGASYEYTVSYTGGAGGNTRITFLNDIATGGPSALIAGDILVIKYTF